VFLLDAADSGGVARYLIDRGMLSPAAAPARVSHAGGGNMNCTLRVVTPSQRVIVKQGRPWVEKYDHIAAPWDRTLVEAAFYETIGASGEIAVRMPRLLYVDRVSRILVLEDIDGEDFTALYAGTTVDWASVSVLIDYLVDLHSLRVEQSLLAVFANREMRALNHEHIFRLPLLESNGLDLDGITPGLQAAADRLKRDTGFTRLVAHLGEVYLADGPQLVHGDFFPGSWLRSNRGPVIIDPEFCFVGKGEFDFGVMLAHFILANQPSAIVDHLRESIPSQYDLSLIRQFAGVEIMRRLIGVAQLPLNASSQQKQAWLTSARELVTAC
jgi:5-methylthioribose kinase